MEIALLVILFMFGCVLLSLVYIVRLLDELKKLLSSRLEGGPTPRAVDGAAGFCECGYMAKYPICTKCGRAYPPRH